MKFETRFKILHPQDMPDGHGGYQVTWTQIGFIWGHVDKASRQGASFAGETSQQAEKTIILRDGDTRILKLGAILHDGVFANEIKAIQDQNANLIKVTTRCQECSYV